MYFLSLYHKYINYANYEHCILTENSFPLASSSDNAIKTSRAVNGFPLKLTFRMSVNIVDSRLSDSFGTV